MMLLCRAIIWQGRIGNFKSPLEKGPSSRHPPLELVRGITRAKYNGMVSAGKASIVARHLDHDTIVSNEHDTESLTLVSVTVGHVDFVTTTGSSLFPIPATTCTWFSLL